MKIALDLVERGLVPKPLIRHGIRRLLDQRLREQAGIYGSDRDVALRSWIDTMRASAGDGYNPGALSPRPASASRRGRGGCTR